MTSLPGLLLLLLPFVTARRSGEGSYLLLVGRDGLGLGNRWLRRWDAWQRKRDMEKMQVGSSWLAHACPFLFLYTMA